MSWTNQQSENLSSWTAQELAQRKILLRGQGAPTFDAPLYVEYLDVGQLPPTLYVKTSEGPSGWTTDAISRASTPAEVTGGEDRVNFVTPHTLALRLADLVVEIQGQINVSDSHDLTASTARDGEDFTVTIPEQAAGQILTLTIQGYGREAALVDILGGEVGQMVTIRKAQKGTLKVAQNGALRLPATVVLSDADHLDNLTLQRISATEWVELARNLY